MSTTTRTLSNWHVSGCRLRNDAESPKGIGPAPLYEPTYAEDQVEPAWADYEGAIDYYASVPIFDTPVHNGIPLWVGAEALIRRAADMLHLYDEVVEALVATRVEHCLQLAEKLLRGGDDELGVFLRDLEQGRKA